jgi:hypothetical protein
MAKKAKVDAETTGLMVGIVILVVVIAAAGYAYFSQKQGQKPTLPVGQSESQVPAAPTPTPTPTKLFHGKDTYYVSGGSADDAHVSQITLDPLDPAVGSQQIFTVKISNKYPVTTAYLTIKTDTKSTKVPLTFKDGAPDNGTWEGTWTVPESYLYNYQVTATAQSQYNQGTVSVVIRERK